MTVAQEISRDIIRAELNQTQPLVKTFGWVLEEKLEQLIFTVRIRSSIDNEEYVMEFKCDNYKETPPFIEFINPVTGERGTRKVYPKNGNGFFHSTPCICAQFNRKAYKEFGGPHGDWSIGNWINLRPEVSTLGDMITLIQRLINNRNFYGGRME